MKTVSLALPPLVVPPAALRLTCLVCLAGTCATGAWAQTAPGGSPSSQISLRVGLSAPGSSAAKDVRSRYLVAGASYGKKAAGAAASTSEVYLDYVGASGSEGKNVTVWGVGASGRKSSSPMSGGMTPYTEVGGGFYFGKASGVGDTRKKNGLGARLDLGLEFGSRFFGQVGYAYLPKLGDINPSGFRIQVGLRL
jgi:hypothetical protein